MGTTTLFFITVNLIKLPGYWLTGLMKNTSPLAVILTLPLVLFGVWSGRHFVKRVNPRTFEALMLALLVAASALLFL
jgi:uncharacterized membrane protein YfcA